MEHKLEIGKSIIYVDTVGVAHDALITAIWSPNCINVLYISKDEKKTDNYGRQIERETSVSGIHSSGAYGRYFRFHDEEAIPYTPPQV